VRDTIRHLGWIWSYLVRECSLEIADNARVRGSVRLYLTLRSNDMTMIIFDSPLDSGANIWQSKSKSMSIEDVMKSTIVQ